MFSTWEQGFKTSPAECPPVECEQSDGATGALYRKDRVSQSAPDTVLVGPDASGGFTLALDRTLADKTDRTLLWRVRC